MSLLPIRGGHIDLEAGLVSRSGRTIPLSLQEQRLLKRLHAEAGGVVRREVLLVEEMGYRRMDSRALDNAVMRLRVKLEPEPEQPEVLITVRGIGYRLLPLPPPAEEELLLGRAADLRGVEALLGAPLVTLWGPGGVGKTTLARELCNRRAGLWIDLRQAHEPGELIQAVARALGVPARGPEPAEDVGLALAARPAGLVVLDDLDALVASSAELLVSWAERLPAGATLLLTSRERLGHRFERCHALGPLSPEEARRLFFRQLPRGAAPAEAEIDPLLALLDGLPLAVELAAAWMDLVSPAQLATRMHASPRVLAARGRGGAPHHASLEAALDASWALLDPAEQRALAVSSLFAGGFDLEAAEAVWELGSTDRWPLEMLGRLCDKALVVRLPEGPFPGGKEALPRYQLLETVRSYAAWRLREPGSQGERLGGAEAAMRHARYYAAYNERSSPDIALLDRERDNARAAIRRIQDQAPVLAARILRARLPADWGFEPPNQAISEVRAVLSRLGEAEHVAAGEMHFLLAQWATRMGRLSEASDALRLAESRAIEAGEESLLANALRLRGSVAIQQGELSEATALLDACLPLARRAGRAGCLTHALLLLGDIAERQEDMERAHALWTEGSASIPPGGKLFAADVLRRLARAELALGDLATAHARLDAADTIDGPESYGPTVSLIIRGWFHFLSGQWGPARESAERLREKAARLDRVAHAVAIETLALVDWAEGRLGEAEAGLETARQEMLRLDRNEEVLRLSLMVAALGADSTRSTLATSPSGPARLPEEQPLWEGFLLLPAARAGDRAAAAELDALIRGSRARGRGHRARIPGTLLAARWRDPG